MKKILVEGKVGYLKEPMLHYSYHSIEDFIRKMNKYASLSAELIVKCHPSKFRVVFKMLFFSFVYIFLKCTFYDQDSLMD